MEQLRQRLTQIGGAKIPRPSEGRGNHGNGSPLGWPVEGVPKGRLRGKLGRPSGSVLLLSLWILAFLGLAAESLSFRMGIALRLTERSWKEIQLEQLARMAVCAGRAAWKKEGARRAAQNQAWSGDNGSFTICGMEDESGKINLNSASAEVLTRLFGVHADVVPAVLDWRDSGLERRPGGAKNSDYERLGYACRNGAFRSLEELLLVKGMTPELFEDVKDSLTVFGSGQVNINTASSRVFRALGLGDPLMRKILLFRKEGVFPGVGTILPLLREKVSLSEDDAQTISKLLSQNRLAVQADCFRLHVLTRLNDSPVRDRFVIVMPARTNSRRLLYWRETGS
jgi:general secretion pathway protein K